MNTTYPERIVLENVPRVGFYPDVIAVDAGRIPEDVPFPSCLRVACEYLEPEAFPRDEEQRDYGYPYLMGHSGAAFRLNWGPGWQQDNVEIMYMSDQPEEPFRRGFAAAGRAYRFLHKPDGEAAFRAAIAESLAAARPVLAFGVVGPPEACLVTGYDECGDALIGWSYFQVWDEFRRGVEFEPDGRFRKRGWFANTEALAILGDPIEKPPAPVMNRDALAWAVTVARTPVTFGNRANGHAAYTAWAAALRDEAEWAAGGEAGLWPRYSVHDDSVETLAEGRWYASVFLRHMAREEPEMADDLLAAAEGFSGEHSLMWKAWGEVGGNDHSPERAARMADPAVRGRIADIIDEARALDVRATDAIQRALERPAHA